jgi:hypothetical protein
MSVDDETRLEPGYPLNLSPERFCDAVIQFLVDLDILPPATPCERLNVFRECVIRQLKLYSLRIGRVIQIPPLGEGRGDASKQVEGQRSEGTAEAEGPPVEGTD